MKCLRSTKKKKRSVFGSIILLLSVYVGEVDAPASMPPASSSLTRTRRMCSYCNQNADHIGSLAGSHILTI
jgi:hypothetical protein